MACMMKLAWGLVNQADSLWVKVMRHKNGCEKGIIPNVRNKLKSSNAWKGVIQV